MNRNTLSDVLENPGDFAEQDGINDWRDTIYTELNEKDELPKLLIEWHDPVSVVDADDETISKLRSEGFDGVEDDDDTSFYFVTVDEYRLYFCNFRRYGWSWSTQPTTGYRGVVYANAGEGFDELYETPEQVVRGTMQIALERMLGEHFNTFKKNLIYNEIRPHVGPLLKDALENMSRHAETPLKNDYRENPVEDFVGSPLESEV